MVDKNQVKGLARQAKGSVKQAVGKATGNRRVEMEGALEKSAGKVQKAFGDLKSKVRKSL